MRRRQKKRSAFFWGAFFLSGKLKYSLYALFVIAAVVVSLYARFPSETFRLYATRQAERWVPGVELVVADARPALPAAVRFQDVEVRYQNQPVLRMEEARLSPDWQAMVKFDPAWHVQADVAGGRVQGTIRTKAAGTFEDAALQGDLDRIDLSKLSGMQRLVDRRISGICSGTVSRPGGPPPSPTEVSLQLADASMEVRQPILQVKEIFLRSVQIDAALIGAAVQIRQCTFDGSEFDGRLAGRIDFENDFSASTVELEGSVIPHAVLLARLKRVLPAQIMAKRGKNGEFAFLLSGSIKNPVYMLK
jgi:type II secretion system protein N